MTVIKAVGGEQPLQFCGAASVNYLADDEVAIGSWIYPRADFLKAVADELDVIVVERSELPEVEPSGATIYPLRTRPSSAWGGGLSHVQATGPNSPNGSPEWHRNRAMAHLALAEYLDANPPTDPKVEALAEVLWENAQNQSGPGDKFHEASEADRSTWRNRAARVLATGRVEVTP